MLRAQAWVCGEGVVVVVFFKAEGFRELAVEGFVAEGAPGFFVSASPGRAFGFSGLQTAELGFLMLGLGALRVEGFRVLGLGFGVEGL